MRIVIIGGGIAAVYLANQIKKSAPLHNVLILSDESYPSYDRIHLCALVDRSKTLEEILLYLDPTVQLELDQKIVQVDTKKKQLFSQNNMYSYDKLIIATGSLAKTPFDIDGIKNASVFRNADEAFKIAERIKHKEVLLVGAGPIALELLDILSKMDDVAHITLLVRHSYLYDRTLSAESIRLIESAYLQSTKVTISYEDEISDTVIEGSEIIKVQTKKTLFENPFVIFGIGITPNIDFVKETLECNRGILTDRFMQTSDPDIFAVGECAQIKESGFIAGHVKACTMQADSALSKLLALEPVPFEEGISTDMLKVGRFELIDVRAPGFDKDFEKIILDAPQEQRVDELYIKHSQLTRFIGLNSNMDIGYVQELMESKESIDLEMLYANRLPSEKGPLVCSCEHLYQQDLVDIITQNGIKDFHALKDFTQAGRVCGKCRQSVIRVIEESQHLIDPDLVIKTPEERKREAILQKVNKRIEKFNRMHPRNKLDKTHLESALASIEKDKQTFNRWISMVTASMQLHPSFEKHVGNAITTLNKIPVIWLELSDCSGNSEAFIKSTNPSIEDLIFNYISLDYHELIMSASSDQSESLLESIIKTDKGKYILIVEGAVPLAMDGKFLRIGTKGETGISLLQRCAKDAALIIAVGSCAYDGGVVAAAPNPTGAVGVSEALQRDDVINITGCPTNPVNIVGTLLHYMMFEEMPPLDSNNRPLWAYEGRIHDNCERRGHYELGEFVKEWGDEGAKKGWCLFEMGCKGPYAFANCPTMKFNEGTSWPVQAGHGCMACTEKNFFDTYAHERKITTEGEK